MMISLIRTLILYIFILLILRVGGKRQIGELQTSELVLTLLISDIAAIPMQDVGQPLFTGIVPIVVLFCCELIISVIILKNSKFRKIVCGMPIIVIKDGKIDQRQMKRLRMSNEDLSEQLRQAGVFNMSEVSYAIVETNGQLSVLKKPEKSQPSSSDLGLATQDKGFEAVVVSDGKILVYSLKLFGADERWIRKILKEQNIDLKDVFIMTLNKDKEFNIIKKGEGV